MNQKTVLVTGSNGFIGKHLVSKLLDNGYEVIAVTRDPNSFPLGSLPAFCNINDYESISEAISRSDFVFHFAGITGVLKCEENYYKTIDTNILGTINVLEASKHHNKPVVYAGVGNIDDNSMYTISKAVSERFVLMYNAEHNTNFFPFRIFNVYGPNQDQNTGKLIINTIHKALNNEPITIYGDGKQVMDFIYVKDVISIMSFAIENIENIENKIYDIGTSEAASIIGVVKLILKLTDSNSKINFESKRMGDKMRFVTANRERFLTNSINFHTLEQGLLKTIESIK